MNAAIIAAAGWKGVGWQAGLAKYPVSFLPLGDGSTPLSRLSVQLLMLGFEVRIGLGKRGYPFGAYQPRQVHGLVDGELKNIGDVLTAMELSPDDTPWTQELYDYASQFGTVVEVDDPGWKNQHGTFCAVIDEIGMDWDRLFLVCGDTLLSSDLLGGIMSLMWPGQYQMHPNHSVFSLDRRAIEIYRSYTEEHRNRWKTIAERDGIIEEYPDGQRGTGRLKGIGIPHYGPHNSIHAEKEWRDIDNTDDFLETRMAIGIGEFDSIVPDDDLWQLGNLSDLSTFTNAELAERGLTYDPSIYNLNWYQGQEWQHDWCQKLMGWVAGEFGPFKSSLDLGAGDGYYSYVMNQMGTEAAAVELHEEALSVFPEEVMGVVHDLREPLDLVRTYELIICLEVAEHLPEKSADTLCDTIARHCGKMLLFTSAPRGQGGHGHCNLQPASYWSKKLEARGLRVCSDDSQKTRQAWYAILNGSLPWLPGNVYIYRKD